MKLNDQLQGLLTALQADDPTDFVQRVSDHAARKEGHDLEELLQAVQRKDVVAVCLGLKHQVDIGVELFTSEEAVAEGQEESEQQGLGAEVLYSAAALARLLLAQNKEAPPEALQQAAELLHDHGLLAAGQYPGLQDEVVKMCLEWWQAEAPGREALTPQTVPVLLVKALQTGTAADVKRCHTMRTALQLFDFDDPCIADLKMLLLRAAFAPSFLRCSEGRRMIAYMFTLQPAFVAELTAIIKNQIPAGRKSVLDHYGEIIYRAWTMCTGACLLNVQQNCIQALMEAAILASTPAMAASLRRVLNGLHCQKHQAGVDKMLLELYEPILFRRLAAANPDVRRNALHLLVDAFPLRDPDESNLETDKRLNDQFAHLTALLKDAVPEVRVAAVQGVCRVLNEFWELIPGTVTASYIRLMAGELAFDASSPAVRAAVAEGLATLVDNALAHPLLKVVLPQVEPLLFDSATRVRTAMADLLLSLRGIEALPIQTVAPVEKLLDVLALDVAPVSSRIQRLLLPTFFPNPEAGPALVAGLLRATPGAGRAFCQYLVGVSQAAEGGEVELTAAGPAVHESQIVGLVEDLRQHLLSAPISSGSAGSAGPGGGSGPAAAGGKAAKKGRTKRRKAQQGDAEVAEDAETEHEVSETAASWEAILQGVAALACGLAALVAAGRCEEDAVQGLFLSGTLVKLLERCPSMAARRAVMAIAAAFPALDASAEVRGRCLKKLLAGDYSASAAASVEQADELRGAVECICAGASRDRLLRVLVTSLNGDPQDVLGAGTGASDKGQGSAAAVAEDRDPKEEEGQQEHGRRRGAKKTAPESAAAKPAAKKKGKKAAAEEAAGEVDESLACEECGSRARGGEMLLCDNCDAAYHMGCLDPPLTELPEGDWFCPGCDSLMEQGMDQELAIRVVSLLMELDEQREQLVGSGALARLLPYLEAALQDRMDALKQALAAGSGLEQTVGQAAASAAMVVYVKGCLHLFLAGQGAGRTDGSALPLSAGITSASLTSQAAECMQQAVDWASTLAQQMARLDAAELLQAVGNRAAPETKRSKASKKKGGASVSQSSSVPAAKEAFATVQACLLTLAEAARVQALGMAAAPGAPALDHATCALAQQFLGVAAGMAAAAGQAAGEAAEAEDVVVAALANVARLARNLAAAARLGGDGPTRNLTTALQLVQQQPLEAEHSEQGSLASGAGAAPPASEGGAVEALAGELLRLGCQEGTSALVVAALKPCMAGLLAALCGAWPGGGSGAAQRPGPSGEWLRPVAELLSRGIDLHEVPAVPSESTDVAAEPPAEAGEGDENAAAAANQAAGDGAQDGPPDKAARGGSGGEAAASFASEHAEHALVKQLLAAAKLAKVQEQLAGCAAALALRSFEEGYSRCALGAVELSMLLGFKGVTSRGRSRAGGDSYAAAIQQLRPLKEAVAALPAEEYQEARACLHHKLEALFPPAPRVTFGAV